MATPATPTARLFAILAREKRTGVIFRRGPSKQVLLIKWDLRDDTFEIGQWLKGRIYERRCDLTPDGSKLVYLAANYRKPMSTWIAVSTPPYLSAITLWEGAGAWGGGGLFPDMHTLLLNLRWEPTPLAGFNVPSKLAVKRIPEWGGLGEDFPIYEARLTRDGWTCVSPAPDVPHSSRGEFSWDFRTSPLIYTRPNPKRRALTLEMRVLGLHQKGGPWYAIDHHIHEDGRTRDFPRTHWADWDRGGDLLYSDGGKLMRVRDRGFGSAKMLADFSDLTFTRCAAPATAMRWR